MGKLIDLYTDSKLMQAVPDDELDFSEDVGAVNSLYNEEISEAELMARYFRWLCGPLEAARVHESTGYALRHYGILLKRLHNIDFTWFVPNDDNRGQDGVKLRESFIESTNLGMYEWNCLLTRPCSVLEMLVALAIRIDDNMEGSGNSPHWFWEMIENLGLLRFTDDNYHHMGGHTRVNRTIQNFLSRKYAANGDGGLFPLKFPRENQCQVEIWYQMQAYIQDRYHANRGTTR